MQFYCDELVFLSVAFRTPKVTNWYFRIFWLLSIVSGITFIHICCTNLLTRTIMKIISLFVPLSPLGGVCLKMCLEPEIKRPILETMLM
jgi:hypothetical protein